MWVERTKSAEILLFSGPNWGLEKERPWMLLECLLLCLKRLFFFKKLGVHSKIGPSMDRSQMPLALLLQLPHPSPQTRGRLEPPLPAVLSPFFVSVMIDEPPWTHHNHQSPEMTLGLSLPVSHTLWVLTKAPHQECITLNNSTALKILCAQPTYQPPPLKSATTPWKSTGCFPRSWFAFSWRAYAVGTLRYATFPEWLLSVSNKHLCCPCLSPMAPSLSLSHSCLFISEEHSVAWI